MLKKVMIGALIWGLFVSPGYAKDPEEKLAETQQAVAYYLENFSSVRDDATLSKAYSNIERTWQDFVQLMGIGHESAPVLSVIRARAASAAKSKRLAVKAWHDALQVNVGLPPERTIEMNIEAANAAAGVKDFAAARQFFAAARAFMFVRGEGADNSRLFLRIQELNIIGESLSWRELNDALTDLRTYSETFPMWTLPRLEAVLAETELRLKFQPEEKEKRLELSTLQAEIALIVDGLADQLPPGYIARVREINYALADNYGL
ncbi:MAG: hypothetical protein HWE08_01890 [Alphaproteobacteria bacterium]|nr:hypothetical protein [Alphaproteobacteria bacterium]